MMTSYGAGRMNLNILPQKVALIMSILAFGAVMIVGMVCEVPAHVTAYRSVLGGIGFWVLGLVLGRIFVNGMAEALAEQMHKENRKHKSSDGN
jgi:hypothetical protein